jgi:hypothetical protein
MDQSESCPACGTDEAERLFRPRIHIHGAKVESAEYNPGLGCVTKNKRHRAEICKRRDLVEVGNEKPDTLFKETVEKRKKEREREWKDL